MAKKYDSVAMLNTLGCGDLEASIRCFEEFRAGRRLEFVPTARLNDPIAWLTRRRTSLRPPYFDHLRCFLDLGTGQRILTLQPYLSAFEQDQAAVMADPKFKRIVAQSQNFASRFKLSLRVYPGGFYCPGQAILIAYSERDRNRRVEKV